MVFRQAEDDIERMDVGLDPSNDVVTAVLAEPELEVDQAVYQSNNGLGGTSIPSPSMVARARVRRMSMQAC